MNMPSYCSYIECSELDSEELTDDDVLEAWERTLRDRANKVMETCLNELYVNGAMNETNAGTTTFVSGVIDSY